MGSGAKASLQLLLCGKKIKWFLRKPFYVCNYQLHTFEIYFFVCSIISHFLFLLENVIVLLKCAGCENFIFKCY